MHDDDASRDRERDLHLLLMQERGEVRGREMEMHPMPSQTGIFLMHALADRLSFCCSFSVFLAFPLLICSHRLHLQDDYSRDAMPVIG